MGHSILVENWSSIFFYSGMATDYQVFLRFLIDPELSRLQRELSASINFHKDLEPYDGRYYNREIYLSKFRNLKNGKDGRG